MNGIDPSAAFLAPVQKPQKAFAAAFAVMALALAGCATGFGASAGKDHLTAASLALADDGTLVASRADAEPGKSIFTVQLRSGELINIRQDAQPVADGTPVLIEYSTDTPRLIPQNASIGYDGAKQTS